MAIVIKPHARDDFHDLATLTIRHKSGKVETPSRMVNRYDLNAKSNIGADVPLMQHSNIFMLQESINPKKLESIMRENGYLDKMRRTGVDVLGRIHDSNLKLLYPSITKKSEPVIEGYSSRQKNNLVRFLCDTAIELGLESLVLPVVYDIDKMRADIAKMGLQFIPVLDMHAKTDVFQKQVDLCIKIGSPDLPMIALKFAKYAKANQAHRYVMERFDAIHEQNQAVMTVGAPRAIYEETYKSVSSPHYGAFFVADLTVEGYYGGGGGSSKIVRLFSHTNLTTPKVNDGVEFDVDTEKTVFKNDELQDLFVRVATGTTTDDDWKKSKPKSISRIHENIRSHSEFRTLSKSIESNGAREYLKAKPDMDTVVTRELSFTHPEP